MWDVRTHGKKDNTRGSTVVAETQIIEQFAGTTFAPTCRYPACLSLRR